MSDEYEAAVEAWNKAADVVRERERSGRPVPDSWYQRLADLSGAAAEAERRAKAARQGELFGDGTARRYL